MRYTLFLRGHNWQWIHTPPPTGELTSLALVWAQVLYHNSRDELTGVAILDNEKMQLRTRFTGALRDDLKYWEAQLQGRL